MLGIDSKEIPVVKGNFATEMREKLYRVRKGFLTDKEIKAEERSKEIRRKYDIV